MDDHDDIEIIEEVKILEKKSSIDNVEIIGDITEKVSSIDELSDISLSPKYGSKFY